MAELVKTVEISTMVSIYSYEVDGETKYDWMSSGGHESDELHDSIAEAIANAETRLS